MASSVKFHLNKFSKIYFTLFHKKRENRCFSKIILHQILLPQFFVTIKRRHLIYTPHPFFSLHQISLFAYLASFCNLLGTISSISFVHLSSNLLACIAILIFSYVPRCHSSYMHSDVCHFSLF